MKGRVTKQMSVSFQLVANMMPSTTRKVNISATMVMMPWENTVLMVSMSFMVRVVELPMGVRSK